MNKTCYTRDLFWNIVTFLKVQSHSIVSLDTKVYYSLQDFTQQSLRKRDKTIDWKNYWCSLETLRVSFVRGERSKHRLHYFTPSPQQDRSSLGPESFWSTATLSDRPDSLNKLTAKSTCLYIKLIILLTNYDINVSLKTFHNLSSVNQPTSHSKCLF